MIEIYILTENEIIHSNLHNIQINNSYKILFMFFENGK